MGLFSRAAAVTAVVSAVVVAGPITSSGATYEAPNANFEDSPNASYATNGAGAFTWATDAAHSGVHALKVSSDQGSDGMVRWLTRTNAISIEPSERYALVVWFKTKDVNHGYAGLNVTYFDSLGRYVGLSDESPDHVVGTSDWHPVALVTRAPLTAAFMRVEFRLHGPGTLWIDDLYLGQDESVDVPMSCGVDPTQIVDFGTVGPFLGSTRVLNVKNVGSRPIHVTIDDTDAVANGYFVGKTELDLQPDEDQSVAVIFITSECPPPGGKTFVATLPVTAEFGAAQILILTVDLVQPVGGC